MPGGEPLAVRNATRQDVRYPPRRCPSGPSPQRGAQGPHERHPGHPQLRRCAPRSSAARVEGIFLARCRSSGGRRAARRGDGASARAARLPVPPICPYFVRRRLVPRPPFPPLTPALPPTSSPARHAADPNAPPQGGLPLARPHQPPELEGGARAYPPPRPSRRRVSCPVAHPTLAPHRPSSTRPAPRLRVTSARAPSRR